MARITLRVPFAQKVEATALGARWDPGLRTWYVPEHFDPGPFARWLPSEATANVRSATYFIAAATRDCWRCLADTHVHGFILPAGHETLSVEEDPKDDRWETSGEFSLLSFVDWLSEPVLAQIQAVTQRYRMEYSNTNDACYWMNFCEHCEAQLGDDETFNEVGKGFGPTSAREAAAIRLREIREPFSARAGVVSQGVEYFDAMTHV
jgi:hypothetical protein